MFLAWIGGGHVRHVEIPLVGFSRTDVDPNPSPRLEVWGGPVGGSVVPFLGWLLIGRKSSAFIRIPFGFFCGLCLVANGAYLALGWTMNAGDAADLRRLGTPAVFLVSAGIFMLVSGLYVWHTLGPIRKLFRP
jgi:hypothetical protein